MRRSTAITLGLGTAAAALAVACGFSVMGSSDSSSETIEGGADGLAGEGASDAGAEDDAATEPVVCRWPSLEQGAVWPMLGGCVDHPGRTIFDGPHQMPSIKFSANVKKAYFAFLVAKANGMILSTADSEGIILVDPLDGGTSLYVDAGGTQYNISSSPAIGASGAIYFGSGDFVASYRADLRQSWGFDTRDEVDTSVVLAADGTVIAGSFNGRLYGLDPIDGGKRWESDLGDDVHSSPAINRATGTIYSCAANHCFAIKPDGGQEWDYNANTSVSIGAPVIGHDGTIFIMTSGGELRALRPDKSVKWTFSTNGPGPTLFHLPAAIGVDGTVYTGQTDTLSALLPEDGGTRWERGVGDPIRTTLLIDASGVIFVGTVGSNIVAVSPQGTVLFTFKVAQQPEALLIGRDGTLYVTCVNGMLYALR